MTDFGLTGKAILVTGAGQGIGRAAAMALAAAGAHVVLGGRDAAKVDRVAEEISTGGGTAVAQHVDVASRESFRAAIQRVVTEFGGINVLINNAGVSTPARFLEAQDDDWHRIFQINAFGVFAGTQEAARAMVQAGHSGKIINTASIAARAGSAEFAIYAASKAAVISLTQSSARALADQGITVNAFAPGVIETPIWSHLNQELYDIGMSEQPTSAMSDSARHIPLGRTGVPHDVEGTILFLASQMSDYMTGQTLIVDGGVVIQ